jgi:DNA primase
MLKLSQLYLERRAVMFIDFAELKRNVSIEQAAQLLNLSLKPSNNQFRGRCPSCNEGDERTLAITPARGLFYCFAAKTGGDCLALVQHITGVGVQEAATFLSPAPLTREAHKSPSPAQRKEKPKEKSAPFDPVKFEASLAYTDEVAALGITEEQAEAFGIGCKRGKVYVPVRWPSGSIAGWQFVEDGVVHFPKTFLPDTANVVAFPKRA